VNILDDVGGVSPQRVGSLRQPNGDIVSAAGADLDGIE